VDDQVLEAGTAGQGEAQRTLAIGLVMRKQVEQGASHRRVPSSSIARRPGEAYVSRPCASLDQNAPRPMVS
jgi:hypothetical protein